MGSPILTILFPEYQTRWNAVRCFRKRNRLLTLFDMGFFRTVSYGRGSHHNFVVLVAMIMKLGTGVKLYVLYTMCSKKTVTSLPLRHYDVIICILPDPYA